MSGDLPEGTHVDASAYLYHSPTETAASASSLTGSWNEVVVLCFSLFLHSFLCSVIIYLLVAASIYGSGNSNRQVTKVKRTESACSFLVLSNLSLVRSWSIWNARKMWTKKECVEGLLVASLFPGSQSTYLYWWCSSLSDIRLTFKLGTDSVITLVPPETSECSAGQKNNDVCSSR